MIFETYGKLILQTEEGLQNPSRTDDYLIPSIKNLLDKDHIENTTLNEEGKFKALTENYFFESIQSMIDLDVKKLTVSRKDNLTNLYIIYMSYNRDFKFVETGIINILKDGDVKLKRFLSREFNKEVESVLRDPLISLDFETDGNLSNDKTILESFNSLLKSEEFIEFFNVILSDFDIKYYI